jgi:hypothetical protein
MQNISFSILSRTEVFFVNIYSTCMKWLHDSCMVCCTWLSNNRTLLILLFIQQNVQWCLNFRGSLFSTTLPHVSQNAVSTTTGKSNTTFHQILYQDCISSHLVVCAEAEILLHATTAGIQVFFHDIFYLYINTSEFTNFPIPTCLTLFWSPLGWLHYSFKSI